MSDKQEWINQHFLLLKYNEMDDLLKNGGFELPVKYRKSITPDLSVEDWVKRLHSDGDDAEAIRTLAHALHRRSAVWWGLCCIEALHDELAEEEKQKAEKAKSEEEEEKKLAQAEQLQLDKEIAEIEERAAANEKEIQEQLTEMDAKITDLEGKLKDIPNHVPKEHKDSYDLVMEKFNGLLKDQLDAPMDQLLDQMNKDRKEEAVRQTAIRMAEKNRKINVLKGQLAKKQKERAAKKEAELAALNKKRAEMDIPLELQTELKMASFSAVLNWVRMPNEENTIAALKAGTEDTDSVEGQLAIAAYWSYGNVNVEKRDGTVVPFPPGLAGNGVYLTLNSASIAKGGLLSRKERLAHYMDLGAEVACGRSNWTLEEEVQERPNVVLPPLKDDKKPEEQKYTYKRWKGPEVK